MRRFERFRTIALAGATVLVLSACAANEGDGTAPVAPPPQWEQVSRQDVGVLLAGSAERAAEARNTLARIERARTAPAPSPVNESSLPAELTSIATIDWSGPGAEAARRIAESIGYEFRIVGNPPASPPMVHVSARNVPIIKVLEDVGLQVQPRGQVVVDPNLRRVEFRYIDVGGLSPFAAKTKASM